MRMATLFGRTARQAPADAEAPSHALLLRAGMVRRVAAGVYTYLPLGLRVLRRIEALARREMAAAGYEELLMPILHPREIWETSGRWETLGPVLFRLQDRSARDFCLAFTNEELLTAMVAAEIRSYRQLPVRLFHIQRKFRDEPRPRSGLIRLREFTMKDAYSFDADQASLDAGYGRMLEAYRALFAACGLSIVVAEADNGVMGDAMSHEVLMESPYGEDELVRCTGCAYAANIEAATATPAQAGEAGPVPLADIATPGVTSIADLARFLSAPPSTLLKTMLYAGDHGLAAALLPGDRAVSLAKLERVAGLGALRPATNREVARAGGAPGYLGPQGLAARLFADHAVTGDRAFIAGANAADTHRRGVTLGRDYDAVSADLSLVEDGQPCSRCGAPLCVGRAIELGHLFALGTRYTGRVGARYLDEAGNEHDLLEASYGVGLDRLLAAIVEQHHDERGIRWPRSVAPLDVQLCALNLERPGVRPAAEQLEQDLESAGLSVLYDDREESAGVKFADADLFGLPLRATVSPRTLARGQVELKLRGASESDHAPLGEAVRRAVELLAGAP